MKHHIAAISLATVVLAACTPTLSEAQPTVEKVPLSMEEKSEGITCIAKGSYPKISGLHSTQIEVNINATLEAYVHQIERNLSACPKAMADLVETGSVLTDTTDVDFSVKRLDQDYFSIVLTSSQYFEGAAHPNNNLTTYTFSLTDGQPIALSEWFLSPEIGEEFLVERINAQLAADDMNMEYPSDTSSGLGAYYITDTELVLTDLYAVHAVQGYEVRIPLAEMTEVMRQGAI